MEKESVTELSFEVESLDAVPEPARGLYKEHESGKFRLNVAGAVPKSKLDEFRDNNVSLNKKLEQFSGIDLEEIEGLRKFKTESESKAEEARRKKAEEEGDFQTLIKEANEKHKKAKGEWETREKTLMDSMSRTFVRAEVAPFLSKRKGSFKILGPEIARRTKLVETDDPSNPFEIEYLTEDGKPLLTEDGDRGGPEELIEALFNDEDWGLGFEGHAGFGGGARNDGGSRGPAANPWAPETRNLTLQMKITRENPALAKELKAAAEAA